MKTPESIAYQLAPLFGLHLQKKSSFVNTPYLSEDKEVLAQKAAAVVFGILGGGVVASFGSYWSSATIATLVGAVDALHQVGAKKSELYHSQAGFFRMIALTQLITTTKLSNRFAGMVVPAITPLMAIAVSYQRHFELSK